MKNVDLHVHSIFSDGTFTPTELINLAKEKNLGAIALTDHDTFDGIEEFLEYGKDKDIELVTGIELSTIFEDVEIHILGLLVKNRFEITNYLSENYKKSRIERNVKMLKKLSESGLHMTMEELYEIAKGKIVARTHFSMLMLKKGYVKTIDEAYEVYLRPYCSTYVKREHLSAKKTIEIINQASGIAVLAHPVLYDLNYDEIDKLVGKLKQIGLQGIEAIYSTYSEKDQQEMIRLSKKYDLLITGGSDFHGAFKPNIQLGSANVPMEVLDKLKKTRQNLGAMPKTM